MNQIRAENIIRDQAGENTKLKHALEVLLARGQAIEQQMREWNRRFFGAVLDAGGVLVVTGESMLGGEVEVDNSTDPQTGAETWTVKRKEAQEVQDVEH